VKYLLDTNICSAAVMGQPIVVSMLEGLNSDDWAISSLVFAELQFGLEKGALRADSANALQLFLDFVPVAKFDREAAARAAWVRAELERQGRPAGAVDELIAGHSLALGATLVTNNTRHFEQVPGLRLESWL
jgi:tRNA(fMet)-specific endonuclease VapC